MSAEYPWRDKEKLKAAIDEAGTGRKAAEILGCDKTTVVKWAGRYGIPLDACNQYQDRRYGKIDTYDDSGDFNFAHLRNLLKRKRWSLIELADALDMAPGKVSEAIESLEERHTLIDSDGGLTLGHQPQQVEAPISIDFRKHAEKEYCIGVTADNHIGSKYERMDVLESLFDRFEATGVKKVYQCGNIIDGESRFNKYDIYVHGVEDQVNNLLQKWPQREGIVTEFITGDCHEGWYIAREHVNIGKYIEGTFTRAGRKDLRYVGHLERDIEYKQKKGSATIRLSHPGGGSPYAVSYPSQKYVESLQGGEKPKIVLGGHYHKFNFGYPREVYCLEAMCTQDQTPFMRKRKLQAFVGGVILWITQNELGVFTSVKAEPLPYFDKKFYQYQW